MCAKAEAHFCAWVDSKAGERWRRKRKGSPYLLGYRQPDWMHEAREALGKGQEERFKRIKLDNL